MAYGSSESAKAKYCPLQKEFEFLQVGLLEQPVVIESGKRKRKKVQKYGVLEIVSSDKKNVPGRRKRIGDIPKMGLLEQPVVIESGKRKRKKVQRYGVLEIVNSDKKNVPGRRKRSGDIPKKRSKSNSKSKCEKQKPSAKKAKQKKKAEKKNSESEEEEEAEEDNEKIIESPEKTKERRIQPLMSLNVQPTGKLVDWQWTKISSRQPLMPKVNENQDFPPSKVVHIRSLPSDVTESEVVQLGLPFGRLTNMLLLKEKKQNFREVWNTLLDQETAGVLVLTKQHISKYLIIHTLQAFLEFEDEQAASFMISHYQSTPAQIRSKSILIQYSIHKELQTDASHSFRIGSLLEPKLEAKF